MISCPGKLIGSLSTNFKSNGRSPTGVWGKSYATFFKCLGKQVKALRAGVFKVSCLQQKSIIEANQTGNSGRQKGRETL